MEPEICPPWWPSLIWWLLHHHPHEPEPEPEWWKWLREPMEEILVALSTYAQAQTFAGAEHEELRKQVQTAAMERLNRGVEQLASR